MLKHISSLKGSAVLNKLDQTEIFGGRLRPGGCLSNCAGQPHGTACYNADCTCPGICSGGQCAMF